MWLPRLSFVNRMKKLLIFLSIIVATYSQLSIAIGIDTTHIRFDDNRDYTLNESNNLIAIEYEKNDHLISISTFENSFFNNSWSINYRYIIGKGNLRFLTGVSLIKGYKELDLLPSKTIEDKLWCFDNPFYIGNDYSIIPTIGLELKLNKHIKLETSLLTNAMVSSFKYTF